MTAPRVGLALGGGVVRGLAHIGVLRVLERAGVELDVICGTSIGAVVGGAYAGGMSVDAMADAADSLRWPQLVRPRPRRRSVFDTAGLDAFIDSIITPRDFGELRCPYAAVARDRDTGERVVLTEGDPARAARASAAIPGLFAPVEIDGRLLVDGAGVEVLPTKTARELGS